MSKSTYGKKLHFTESNLSLFTPYAPGNSQVSVAGLKSAETYKEL